MAVKTTDRDNGGITAVVADQAPEFAEELSTHDTTLEKTGQIGEAEEASAMKDARSINHAIATELIDFDLLFRKDNVRTSQSLNLPKMVQSLKDRGFKPNHPLVVSEKNDRFQVLCGNRRTEALEIIRKEDSKIFDAILPGCQIPCIVHRGLTEQQEIVLRIDHSDAEDREPLDEWGEFLAVRQLMRAGYATQKDIAGMLGKFNKNGEPNRSWVQQRVNLARLPKFVQDEMEKLCTRGKEATSLRWANVPGLFTLWNDEFKLGHKLETGPEFNARWEEIMEGSEGTTKPKALTRTKIVELAKNTGSILAKRVLFYVSQEPISIADGVPIYQDWSSIEEDFLKTEAAMETLKGLAIYMGEEPFKELILESKHHNDVPVDSK